MNESRPLWKQFDIIVLVLVFSMLVIFTIIKYNHTDNKQPRTTKSSEKNSTTKIKDELTTLIERAEQGDPKSQLILGERYLHGKAVPQDLKESLKWYRSAAEQGVAVAQFNLGNAYHRGIGTQKNIELAKKYWLQAAKQNLAQAQFNLGMRLLQEKGIVNKESFYWLELSANQGYKPAQVILQKIDSQKLSQQHSM